MYKLTNSNVIINTVTTEIIPIEENNPLYQLYLKWVEDGNTPEGVDPPSLEEYKRMVTSAIQRHLDTTARQYNFDTIVNACAWAGALPVADQLKAWGASCWAAAYVVEQEVLNEERVPPTPEEMVDELPVFTPTL